MWGHGTHSTNTRVNWYKTTEIFEQLSPLSGTNQWMQQHQTMLVCVKSADMHICACTPVAKHQQVQQHIVCIKSTQPLLHACERLHSICQSLSTALIQDSQAGYAARYGSMPTHMNQALPSRMDSQLCTHVITHVAQQVLYA